MRIVYFGSGEFGLPSIQHIKESEHNLVHVFSQAAHKAGRGRKLRSTPIGQWAKENDLPLVESDNINTPEMIEKITALKADLLVVIAFGQKISPEIISIFPKGAINVHSSLLPKYRGAAPINWAIINGDSETGVSIITLAQTMDAGEILGQAKTSIAEDDTANILHDRLANLSPELLLETIDKIEAGKAELIKQDKSLVTKAPKFKKADGYIDWKQPADIIRNKIRGMWTWPGAQAFYVSSQTGKTDRVTIALAELVEIAGNNSESGMLDDDLSVICGDGKALKIIKLKPAGKGLMDFKSFANGRSAKAGDIFLPIEKIQ